MLRSHIFLGLDWNLWQNVCLVNFLISKLGEARLRSNFLCKALLSFSCHLMINYNSIVWKFSSLSQITEERMTSLFPFNKRRSSSCKTWKAFWLHREVKRNAVRHSQVQCCSLCSPFNRNQTLHENEWVNMMIKRECKSKDIQFNWVGKVCVAQPSKYL